MFSLHSIHTSFLSSIWKLDFSISSYETTNLPKCTHTKG